MTWLLHSKRIMANIREWRNIFNSLPKLINQGYKWRFKISVKILPHLHGNGQFPITIFNIFINSFLLSPPAHSVRRRPSKIVPRQTQAKFLFRDDQSYFLTINQKKIPLLSMAKCPKSRPKNRAYFIKADHRRNHSRVKFATQKMFAMMHLRKKKFSNFPDSGSGIRIRTI